MCQCEICKRGSRTATIIGGKVVCMGCLAHMLKNELLAVRGPELRLDLVAVLTRDPAGLITGMVFRPRQASQMPTVRTGVLPPPMKTLSPEESPLSAGLQSAEEIVETAISAKLVGV